MVDKWLVETDLSDEWDFYTRANVGEVFPDPVAPLSFFYFQHDDAERGRTLGGSEMGFRNAYYRIGVMTPDELPDDLVGTVGVTAGASASEELVNQVIEALGVGPEQVELVKVTDEDEYFPPPRNLRKLVDAIDVATTFSLGGSVPGRPRAEDRSMPASTVLAALA